MGTDGFKRTQWHELRISPWHSRFVPVGGGSDSKMFVCLTLLTQDSIPCHLVLWFEAISVITTPVINLKFEYSGRESQLYKNTDVQKMFCVKVLPDTEPYLHPSTRCVEISPCLFLELAPNLPGIVHSWGIFCRAKASSRWNKIKPMALTLLCPHGPFKSSSSLLLLYQVCSMDVFLPRLRMPCLGAHSACSHSFLGSFLLPPQQYYPKVASRFLFPSSGPHWA